MTQFPRSHVRVIVPGEIQELLDRGWEFDPPMQQACCYGTPRYYYEIWLSFCSTHGGWCWSGRLYDDAPTHEATECLAKTRGAGGPFEDAGNVVEKLLEELHYDDRGQDHQ